MHRLLHNYMGVESGGGGGTEDASPVDKSAGTSPKFEYSTVFFLDTH